jgi:ribosome-binding protein aMBF1 (putative translation factor)
MDKNKILKHMQDALALMAEEKFAEGVEKLSQFVEEVGAIEETEQATQAEAVIEEEPTPPQPTIEEVAKTVSLSLYNDTLKEAIEDMKSALEVLASDMNATKETVQKIASARAVSQQVTAETIVQDTETVTKSSLARIFS